MTDASQWTPSRHIKLTDNTTNDARWDLWDGKVQDPMSWFSGKTHHQYGQFQFGVPEKVNEKAGQLTATEILRCCSLQSGRLLFTACTSSPVLSAHTRIKQSVYAGPLNFERLQIDRECTTTRILWMERYSKHYVLVIIISHRNIHTHKQPCQFVRRE